jgi:hypothetical protein
MAQPIMKSNLADGKAEVINNTRGANMDAVTEKKLLRKCDIHILPPMFVLLLLAFLDRTNIGMILMSNQQNNNIILTSTQAMPESKA